MRAYVLYLHRQTPPPGHPAKGSVLSRPKAALRKDEGISLAELLIAMRIVVLVGVLATIIVAASTRATATADAQTSAAIDAGAAATQITETLSNATLGTATNSRIVAYRNEPYRCDEHTYIAVWASGNPYILHRVKSIATGEFGRCNGILPSAWNSEPVLLEERLVDRLVPNPNGLPTFTYYSAGNGRILASGDSGYNPNAPLRTCAVARVAVEVTKNPRNLLATADGYTQSLVNVTC